MADTKISALADVVTLEAGDKVPVADASDLTVSKSATMTELRRFVHVRPYARGTFTVTTGHYSIMAKVLQLTTSERCTIQGTGRLTIIN